VIEPSVRTGIPADMPALMDLAKLGAEENGMVPYNLNAIAAEFWPALNLDYGIVGIIGPPDAPEGAVLLRVTTFWYGFSGGSEARPMLEERWLFCKKEFRAVKGGRARKLCEFAKSSADLLGLPLMIGILSDIRLDAKQRLYERVFGEPCGVSWIYRPKSAMKAAPEDDQVIQASVSA
jgi:hypothetical protein